MLTADQISAIATERGDTVTNPDAANPQASTTNNDVQDRLSKFDELVGNTTPPAPAQTPTQTGKPGLPDFVRPAIDATVKEGKEGFQKMIDSVDQDPKTMTIPGEQEIGLASGALRTAFAPVTGIIQTLVDKAQDSKALQDFAMNNKTTGGILDLHDQLQQKLAEVSKAHPEAAKNVGDIANILLAALGGEAAPESAAIEEGGAPTAESAAAVDKAVTPAKDGAPIATEAPAGAKSGFMGNVKANAITALKSAYSQIYGFPPDTIDFLMKNPHFATPEALSEASLANLGKEVEGKISEAGKEVPKPADITEEVRQGLLQKAQALKEHAQKYSELPGKAVDVDPKWLHDQLTNIAGVKIRDSGMIEHGPASSKINPADSPNGTRILQDLWDTYGPEFAKGKMTQPMFLKFRQSLANIANYGGAGERNVLENVGHTIRDNFNKTYRPNIKGLDALDAEHVKLQNDFDNSMKGLGVQDPATGEIKMQDDAAGRIMNATKDTKDEFAKRLETIVPGITDKVAQAKEFKGAWSSLVDDAGHLKENALNGIKNSVNAGRDLRLQKLEEIMPGITERIRHVKAAEDFHGTLGLKPGKYASGAAMSQILTGNPLMGLAAVAATTPAVGLKILRTLARKKAD